MRYVIALLLLAVGANSALAYERCEDRRSFWGSKTVECDHQKVSVTVSEDDIRDVLFQVPTGTPPTDGWPVVFIYQGSFIPVEFSGKSTDFFGGYHQIRLIRTLLESGFSVIAPRAYKNRFWDTNTKTTIPYEDTPDYRFLTDLFDRVGAGDFGPLNPSQMYATGISSGGYNTSRMAVSFPGKFRALAVQSASYATCAGPACSVPDPLPEDHPPTLLLHGSLDWIVGKSTMERYHDQLYAEGVPTRKVIDFVGHQWLRAAPDEVLNWFLMHP